MQQKASAYEKKRREAELLSEKSAERAVDPFFGLP